MKPVIAIPRSGTGLYSYYMKSKYAQALRRAGAEVRWITLENVDRAVEEMLRCDGLLIPGGDDINPALYGQAITEKCGKPDDHRDAAEMKLLEMFLSTNKPILCVCRGMQLLNVFFNGTLHQDIKGIQVCRHAHLSSIRKGAHSVKLYPNTKLGQIMEEETVMVNSLHHQAVDILGPGLTVSAVSQDGFIEGVEVFLHPFCLGVQWHPEHMAQTHSVQARLFATFVKACMEK